MVSMEIYFILLEDRLNIVSVGPIYTKIKTFFGIQSI